MKDAFKFCSQIAAQLAVRRDAAEAVRRPAGFVRRILFARPTRHVPKPSMIDRLVATYSGADSIAICGQLCDGESRTGTPWPMGDRMRFSRWTERLPRWLEPCIGGTKPRRDPAQGSKVQSLLVIADRFDTAQPLLLWADSVGVFAAWHPRFVPALHGRFKTILWDDSAAMATSANHWQQRLSEACQNGKSPEHIWMSLQPSIDEIEQAKRGGISHVLTKPVMIDAILPITNRLA
ncbi:MAG TPA: hypothetical protein DDZ51_17210 [Planctomycetaceae bacterium]|nr:hypothetical protein [Planctomycetaceae bacterium]